MRNFGFLRCFVKIAYSKNMCRHYIARSHFTNANMLRCKNINTLSNRSLTSNGDDSGSDIEEMQQDECIDDYEDQPVFSRSLLYPDSNDPLIKKITGCTSLQEVLDTVKNNTENMYFKHLTQTVLVLWDLVKILHHMNGIPCNRTAPTTNFMHQLHDSSDFKHILQLISEKLEDFDVHSLSYVLLYLRKLGLRDNHELQLKLIEKTRLKLITNYSNDAASRYFVAIFTEPTLRSYYNALDLVPLTIKSIDTCDTAEDLKVLTICLHNIHSFVTQDVLSVYKRKMLELIERKVLTSNEYKPILKMLLLFSLPKWKDHHISEIRTCANLLKNNLHCLNLNEILLVYEVFFNTHEPGDLQTEIQRMVKKHLVQMEEELNPNLYMRLKLLAALVTMSSKIQRVHYETIIKQYMEENLSVESLFYIRKILVCLRTRDKQLCDSLWSKLDKFVDLKTYTPIKFAMEYLNFKVDIPHYRHSRFEKHILHALESQSKINSYLFPSTLAQVSVFRLTYSTDNKEIENTVNSICENWEQLNAADWLKISKACSSLAHADKLKVNRAINSYVLENYTEFTIREVNLLFKSYIHRNDLSSILLDYILYTYGKNYSLSSSLLKHATYCFKCSAHLLPNFMEDASEYVVSNAENMLATVAERFLFLCYWLGYQPKNHEILFDTITNLLIRDRERLNGLTYLQSCLSLCFFNRLPNSFIKDIFNVTFLENLDEELANCYSKDRYPIRVRQTMMLLNRAVCLDYPEANIPWFHGRYIEENQNQVKSKSVGSLVENSVYESLLEITKDVNAIERGIFTPYGYFLNFVVNFNVRGEIVPPGSSQISTRCALIVVNSYAYTRKHVQLKGFYQLQQRHLEILGYKVIFVNSKEWLSLKENKNRINFLKTTIWQEQMYNKCIESVS